MKSDLFLDYLKKTSRRYNVLLDEIAPKTKSGTTSYDEEDDDENPDILTPPPTYSKPERRLSKDDLNFTPDDLPPEEDPNNLQSPELEQPPPDDVPLPPEAQDGAIDQAPPMDNTQGAIQDVPPNINTATTQPMGGDPNAMGGDPNAAGGDPNAMGGDPNAMGGDPNAMGGDPNAMGEDPNAAGGLTPIGMPEPLEPVYLGKIMMLKKINARLLGVKKQLSFFSDPKYNELKTTLYDAIDVFKNIVANFDQFKEQLDEIIIGYQNFLESIVNKFDKLSK